ncbi:N-acetyltransferase [Nodosilinea sp. LEGE 07088]|jgi:L-amino acid N-acyltransferase YncA|uniref:arsinothricin resistance N-acetyltransferase ArsN1 family B n=1 Tax=unclassified Nodosilinea TaxID=2628167 RepID=UPI001882B232|nr:arsinothricin resistance N-acetyltransferase ArsN1 family B [Nodosilinea sp. LEGE 07088]MBE9137433.1 N-acetyltransferase [Nodosilinea sp. LEGE 07088]
MSSTSIIRLASKSDAAQVQDIYAPFVRDTPISFEAEPPSVKEMQQRIEDTLRQFPWLICEHQAEVVGYVYANSHRARAAYLWSVDVSVYIHQRYHRSGVGKALYLSLFEILRLQGFCNAYAGATLPNPASVGLHEALGFQPVGVYEAVGYKFRAWHSVIWWQLALQERSVTPALPLPIGEVKERAEWQAALNTGLPFLKL